MFPKNALVYRFTRKVEFLPEVLEQNLSEFAFHACTPNDMQTFGWSTALGIHGKMLTHTAEGAIFITAHQEEKMFPASVVRDAMVPRVKALEDREGRRLSKAEKDALKDDVVATMLPQAFSRHRYTSAIIFLDLGYIVIDASSPKSAENFLALLRKSIGSLPVVPVSTRNIPTLTMTNWGINATIPTGFNDAGEVELKHVSEGGGTARCKDQQLGDEEVQLHLKCDKLVTKLRLDWQGRMEFTLCDDLSIKRIKWSDAVKDSNSELDRDDVVARLDADFCLICGEYRALLPNLYSEFGGVLADAEAPTSQDSQGEDSQCKPQA